MGKQGLLIVVSGPSGAGKGTICSRLLADNKETMSYSVSCTTRAPRAGEVEGVNYFFTDKEKFEKMIGQAELLEHANVFGNYYGTPRSYVLQKLEAGLNVLLEIDVQGALQVKQSYPEGVFIFIAPPSLAELRERIYKRGTDSEEVIRTRLAGAKAEIELAKEYDYLVVNDELEAAIAAVENIVAVEQLRTKRKLAVLEQICQEA